MRRFAPAALVAASGLVAACVAHGSVSPGHAVVWSQARAEARVVHAPPKRWTERGWAVAAAVCDGLGKPTLGRGRRAGAGPVRPLRLFPNFSCEIRVVRPVRTCPSAGIYVCVAGWEATAEERTLHVLGTSRYALYRVPG